MKQEIDLSRSTLIRDVYIVNEMQSFRGYVVVCDEMIAQVGKGDPEAELTGCATIIEGNGRLLLPGVIDTHVHFRDPGLTHKADMANRKPRRRCRWRDLVHRHAQHQTADGQHGSRGG